MIEFGVVAIMLSMPRCAGVRQYRFTKCDYIINSSTSPSIFSARRFARV